MTETISGYLSRFAVPAKTPFTHTSLGPPRGSYNIPQDELPEFFGRYRAAVDLGVPLHITEAHRDLGPIVIDFDFRFAVVQGQAPQREYAPQHVDDLLRAYFGQLAHFVDCEGVRAFVMEKPGPRIDKGVVKDGLHVVIPDVVTGPGLQHLLRERCLPVFEPTLALVGITNDVKNCVDDAVIQHNNWLMVGSSKEGQPPYAVTRVVRWSGGELADVPVPEGCLVELLSLRNKEVATPLLEGRQAELDEYCARRKPKRAAPAKGGRAAESTARNESPEVDFVRKLAAILAAARADDYGSWMRVGWCLRNIDHRLLDSWVAFSRLSKKFREGECDELWAKMGVTDALGLPSLRMWARQDDPDGYALLVNTDIQELMRTAAMGKAAHWDVARVVYRMFGTEYVCASVRNNSWYEFRNHRWHASDGGVGLCRRLSEEVHAMFEDYYRKLQAQAKKTAGSSKAEANLSSAAQVYIRQLQEKLQMLEGEGLGEGEEARSTRGLLEAARSHVTADDAGDKKPDADLLASCKKVMEGLKNTPFKRFVMAEAATMFSDPLFEERLDSKCHLLGFENGVYDLDAMQFRAGMPEDTLSLTTGLVYQEADVDSTEWKDLVRFFEMVLPSEEVREYVLMHMGSCLHGAVREERFHIWTGVGCNGKSKTVELLEGALGQYAFKLPVALLTNKRAASNAASSEIVRAKGRRFGCLQEPSEADKFNVGLMKELTGNDVILARALYKEPVEFKPQYKLCLLANHLPQVAATDKGTWRRIRVVEFLARFVDNPDPSRPYEHSMDRDLQQRLLTWRQQCMALLLVYYAKYREVGKLVEPYDVLRCTRAYQESNDVLGEFLRDCVEESKDPDDSVTLSDLYGAFKSFLEDQQLDRKPCSKKEFKNLLREHNMVMSNIVRASYEGWRLKDFV